MSSSEVVTTNKGDAAETTSAEAAAATTATTTTTSGGGDSSSAKQPQDDRKPVEELYDLTKPIKRVEKPNKDDHEKELDELTLAIDNLKKERRDIQDKIDSSIESSRTSEVSKIRDELSRLRSKKGLLISEKKGIRSRLDAVRSRSERTFEEKKRAKDTMKYTTMEEIETELKRLRRRQETTSMSLMEEKRLIKEMDALQASKKMVATLKSKESEFEDARKQRNAITAEINAKDKEIDEVAAAIDVKSESLKKLSETESDSRSSVQELFKERDEIKKRLHDAHEDKNAARQAFREANNKWYDYQRALRAQRKMQVEEEKRQREEERQAWLKKKEEEDAKKIPYEEEMALCDYLAEYLTKTYLADNKQNKKSGNDKNAAPILSDNPFAGFKPLSKKKNDDDVFLQMGGGKKPKQRNKQSKTSKKEAFTLNVETFGQFGLLDLTPPTNLDTVLSSVQKLKEKKDWYSQQPRGSVPTADSKRRAQQEEAEGEEESREAEKRTRKKQPVKGFSLDSDDFAPLSVSTTSLSEKTPFQSSWGAPASSSKEGGTAGETEEGRTTTETGDNGTKKEGFEA